MICGLQKFRLINEFFVRSKACLSHDIQVFTIFTVNTVTLVHDVQVDVITSASREVLKAWWPLLDSALKRQLRLASKALRQAVDVQVQHLEVTPDQATVEGMEQASRRWHMVTRLDVHVREPNPLTMAAFHKGRQELTEVQCE